MTKHTPEIRPWTPLSKKHLAAVIMDTEQDSGGGMSYCPDDVYRMARELERSRSEVDDLAHACLAALGFHNGVSILGEKQLIKTLVDAVRPYVDRKGSSLT